VTTASRGSPAGAIPSVVKAIAEVPPRMLRGVDRLSRNPEPLANVGGSTASDTTLYQSQSQAWNSVFEKLSTFFRLHIIYNKII